jgi:prolyl-tRNA editing enzyme YbaK/EbsC (Cys-tRNA(Pro) deacylase)
VLIDRRLLVDGTVWVGAGSHRHLAGLPAGELLRLTRAEPVDISDDT